MHNGAMRLIQRPPRSRARQVFAFSLAIFLAGCSFNTPWFEMRVGEPTAPSTVTASVVPATATPEPPPLPTPAPTPTPTPTPNPQVLIAEAEASARAGAGAQAIELLQRAAPLLPAQSAQAASARLRLGQLRLAEGDPAGAARDLGEAAASGANAEISSDAQVLLGRALAQTGDNAGAIKVWTAALSATSPLSTYLHVWIGDAQIALKAPTQAITPFLRALDDTTSASQAAVRREKLALARQLAGDYAGAAADYDAILAFARIPAYRARIQWEKAQTLVAGRDESAGYALMQQILSAYPAESAAFSALKALLDADQPVDELQRGIVNYHAQNYAAARLAFVRAINALTPRQGARSDDVLFWAGLNYLALESPADAARNLDPLIANPRSARYADALQARASALVDSGQVDEAVRLYRLRAEKLIGTPAASEALASAANALERAGRHAEAATLYAAAVPGAPPDEAGQWRGDAAVARFRSGGTGAVLKAAAPMTVALAAGLREPLWIAKAAQIAGDGALAAAWRAAITRTAPASYEAIRVSELGAGRAPMSRAGAEVTATTSLAGFEDATRWLSAWTGVTVTGSISPSAFTVAWDTPSRGMLSRAFLRGIALLRVGLSAEAGAEFDVALVEMGADPVALFQAAVRWRELGVYRLSIMAAARLISKAPGGAPAVPDFVARLSYPVYFSELIEPAAREFKVDPLLVYSLIRQESLFEADALSSAAARGLMQVVPATGKEIAGQLNWPPGYTTRDLNRPAVSVRFGVYYFSRQLNGFDGDAVAALAAYNAGPGRALRWRDQGGGDPDMFIETMTLDEPVTYVRNIAVNFAAYTRLYGR